MDVKKALAIVSKECPCEHYATSELGTGNWLRCEDCGALIAADGLEARRQAAADFDEAMSIIRMSIKGASQ